MIFDSYEAYKQAGFKPKVCVLGSGPAGTTIARKLGAAGIPEIGFDTGGDIPTPTLSTTAPLLDATQANINNLIFNQTHNSGPHRVGKYKIRNRLFCRNRSQCDESPPAIPLHVRNYFAREIDRAHKVRVHGFAPVVNRGG